MESSDITKKKKDFLLIEIGKILLHRFESLNTACTSDGHKRSVVVGVVGVVGGRGGDGVLNNNQRKKEKLARHSSKK